MTGAALPFDLAGPLPTGVTLLEASAGTGKTHAIASLALRFVADGTPLERLLIVTFTRLATGELRERVRGRLVEGLDVLDAAALGREPPADAVLRALVTGTGIQVAERRDRVRAALAGFDAATISTTHGFCQEVLDGLGVAGDTGRGIEVTADLGGLVRDIVDDLYVGRFSGAPDGAPTLSYAAARRVAESVVMHPDVPIVPALEDASGDVAVRVRFACDVRREFDARKRRMGVLGYDDLLARLAHTLRDPDAGPACRARLAARFHVALIDEFQDTDPVQWDIVREGFSGGALVLIGDPKQAIYAFRGADVHTYLGARGQADTAYTLAVNWRSDQRYLWALDALFDGARLGHADIVVHPVTAAPHLHAGAVGGAAPPEALRVRIVRRDRADAEIVKGGFARADWARAAVCDDVVAQIAALLDGGRIPDRPGKDRPVRTGDIGVLTRTNDEAAMLCAALEGAGIPAVMVGTGSVFDTRAADDWTCLLAALERPADPSRASAAALTMFIGWDARRLAESPEDARAGLHERLQGWRDVLVTHGVAALFETINRTAHLTRRLLRHPYGERDLTDLRHIARLLHQAAVTEGRGISALVDWITAQAGATGADADEEHGRRLETDSEAVRVLTVHRAKGLEFGIVCVPFLWNPSLTATKADILVVHDPADETRVVDVGGEAGAGFGARLARAKEEQRAEDLRLAYVALTRARHQALVWWVGISASRHSSLSRLVVDRAPGGAIPHNGSRVPSDDELRALVEAIAERAPGCVSVEDAPVPEPATAPLPTAAPAQDLAVASFGRTVDRGWGRHSYSGITAGTYEALVASEPEAPALGDEPDADAASPNEPAPVQDLPAGTAFGSLVHGILEEADFAAADLDAELARAAARQPGGTGHVDGEALVRFLSAAVGTPLGAPLGDVRLRDVASADRLNELGFELPLAGGEAPAGRLDPAAIADLLEQHLPADDPVAAYPDMLRAVDPHAALRGFMVGSLDLVVRLAGPDGPRFAVMDHKTNLLGTGGAPALRDYHPASLAREMCRHHYVLQALIYQVALHRYLRWRLPAYDPARHLAGAHYLFLRGMVGAGTPALADGSRHGIFSWTPPAALVVAASDLFHAGRADG